jgi:hypothetical protein
MKRLPVKRDLASVPAKTGLDPVELTLLPGLGLSLGEPPPRLVLSLYPSTHWGVTAGQETGG